ncbi:MAG: LAGLIDADG family homing endonuclease [Nanoarchaeota archaeon]
MVKIIDEVNKYLPQDANITETVFEGANIVLYTKNKKFLLDNQGVIKQIVDNIKKRVELRADPSIVLDIEETKELIKKTISAEAGETEIIFDVSRSRVIIEAEKPGIAIGKGGEVLKEIKAKTFWTPIVRRIPPIRSQLLENIRQVLYDHSEYRKKFLNKVGKRIYEGWTKTKRDEWIRLTCLGSAREVGRSCFLIQTPESTIMLDCGFNVAAPREFAFPYLDVPEFNIQELDAVILSHPHIDHCGTLPYLYKMGYRGPVYCTAPTRDVAALLCLDMSDIAMKEGNDPLYDTGDVKEMVKHTICLDYGEVADITPDMRLTLYNAGHNLGSAMVHLHIGNGLHNFLYSLDASTKITLIDPENNTQFIGIGDFIDKQFEEKNGLIIDNGFVQEKANTKGYATIAFNKKTLKNEIVNITSFVRHPINEELYEIKTESGRSVKVTKSHSLFTAKDGKILPAEVSKLKTGDFIVGSKKIPSLNVNEPIIDLMPYSKELRIKIEDDAYINNLIIKHEAEFSKLENNDKLIVKSVLFDYYKGNYIKDIRNKYKIHPRRINRIFKQLGLKTHPRVKDSLPDKVRITKDFARFLGYYISEGWPNTKDQTVAVSNTNKEILEDCYNIIKKEFGIEGDLRYQDDVVLFTSKQLKSLLSNVLKCGKDAYTKRIPKELLLTNRDVQSDLLYGLFSGDGGIRVREKGREINYASKSKGLIEDINFILLQFGIVPTIEFNKTSEMNNLHIYNKEKIAEFLSEININNSQNTQLVESLLSLKQNKASFDMRIPISALSQTIQNDISKTPWQNAESCGIQKLENENLTEDDLKLINSDLMFDKIKSIKQVESTGKYVYDLRVDGYENFLGGDGFLFMHNTGDFNYETSNLLSSSESKFPRVESVMMESTYGTKQDNSPSRKESEDDLIRIINETATAGGKVLMPVLGVGRSQECMLILERAMEEKKIPQMPIYVQGMVWDVTALHTAYPDFLSNRVKKGIFQRDHNPFLSPIFKKVISQKEMAEIKEGKGPYVVMATSGMLQGGPSLEYLKAFAENPKNCVVLTSYQGVGSIGRRLQDGEKELTFTYGGSKRMETIKINLPIYTLSGFSGHSNFKQLVSWVKNIEPKPKKFITIHGDYSRCIELASVIYQQNRVETVAPKNLETIRLR